MSERAGAVSGGQRAHFFARACGARKLLHFYTFTRILCPGTRLHFYGQLAKLLHNRQPPPYAPSFFALAPFLQQVYVASLEHTIAVRESISQRRQERRGRRRDWRTMAKNRGSMGVNRRPYRTQ